MSKNKNDPRVHYGPPPESWLWDYHPLAEDAWGNILGFNDGAGDGQTIEMRLWLRPQDMSNFPPPAYRPAHAPLPRKPKGRLSDIQHGIERPQAPYYLDGGVRRCYVPQAEDLELVRRLWPTIKDTGNPPWPRVEAELVAAGKSREDLVKMNAPTLLLLLAKAKGFPSADDAGHRPKAPHRPRQHDPVDDAKIAQAWQDAKAMPNKPTQAEFEEAKGLAKGELARILDRERKRRKRDSASG